MGEMGYAFIFVTKYSNMNKMNAINLNFLPLY